MPEQRFKKIFMWPCEKYLILGVRTKVICFKNISKFCDNGSTFTWFIVQPNTQTVGQTLKYRITTLLIMVPPRKRNLFKNNSSINNKYILLFYIFIYMFNWYSVVTFEHVLYLFLKMFSFHGGTIINNVVMR